MTLADSMSTFDKLFIVGLAAIGVLAVLAVSLVLVGRPRLDRRAVDPGERLGRDVATALESPEYAPYGTDASRIDYVARAVHHQECDTLPDPHIAVHTRHCRCGQPWVCEMAGPLNTGWTGVPQQRNRNDDDRWWS